MDLVTRFGAVNPISGGAGASGSGFYVVLETHGSCADHDREKLDRFLQASARPGLWAGGRACGAFSAGARSASAPGRHPTTG